MSGTEIGGCPRMGMRAVAGLVIGVISFACLDAGAQEPSQLERGEEVFGYWCATCHGPGPGMPGTQALQAKYSGNLPAVLTQRTDLTAELIAFYVRNGISVMPFFRKTEISDDDLAAIAAYVTTTARSQ
jgi:mono/diheme cytochrome c family protein